MKQYVKRYVKCHTIPITLPGLPPPIYDAITELWFDSVEDIAKVFTAESYIKTIRPDEEKFLNLHGCNFLVSTETPVI